MRIKELLEASIKQPIIAYHGTPANIEKFDSSFMGTGLDRLGSGFYFTSDYDDALTYTDDKRNVLKVSLDIKNPLNSTANGSLNKKQALAIIKQSPTLEDDLNNHDDVASKGLVNVLNKVVEYYTFNNENILVNLHKIARLSHPPKLEDLTEDCRSLKKCAWEKILKSFLIGLVTAKQFSTYLLLNGQRGQLC